MVVGGGQAAEFFSTARRCSIRGSIEMWGGACVRMFASGGVSAVARTDAMSHNAAVQRIGAGSPLRSLRAHKEGGRRKRLIDKNRNLLLRKSHPSTSKSIGCPSIRMLLQC